MPSSKNYQRNYKQEAATESTARKEARYQRNDARRIMIAEGKVKRNDGLDVGHKKAISRGGTNSLKNLFVQDPTENRSFQRHPDGSMKSETSKKERKKK